MILRQLSLVVANAQQVRALPTQGIYVRIIREPTAAPPNPAGAAPLKGYRLKSAWRSSQRRTIHLHRKKSRSQEPVGESLRARQSVRPDGPRFDLSCRTDVRGAEGGGSQSRTVRALLSVRSHEDRTGYSMRAKKPPLARSGGCEGQIKFSVPTQAARRRARRPSPAATRPRVRRA